MSRQSVVAVLVLAALGLSACSSQAPGPGEVADPAPSVASVPTATPAPAQEAPDTAPTQEAPVSVNINVSGVPVEQATICSDFGVSNSIQRALGDSTLMYMPTSSIGLAPAGLSCTWENAESVSISISTGDFPSASAASTRLTGLRTTLPNAQDISVNGSDQAFADPDFTIPVALAQFGAQIVQVSFLSMTDEVDGSVPGKLLSTLLH